MLGFVSCPPGEFFPRIVDILPDVLNPVLHPVSKLRHSKHIEQGGDTTGDRVVPPRRSTAISGHKTVDLPHWRKFQVEFTIKIT